MTDIAENTGERVIKVDEAVQKARLGQDVVIAGLANGIDSRTILTKALEIIGMTQHGYSDALGSLISEGYVLVVESESTSDQPHILRFEITEKAQDLLTDDTRYVDKAYEIIQSVMDEERAHEERRRQFFSYVALDPIERRALTQRVAIPTEVEDNSSIYRSTD